MLNLNLKKVYRARTRVLTTILLRPACRFIFSEQVLQRMCVCSFQRRQRLWDSDAAVSQQGNCAAWHLSLLYIVNSILCNKDLLEFLYCYSILSSFIQIFMCAGVGTDLISHCICLHLSEMTFYHNRSSEFVYPKYLNFSCSLSTTYQSCYFTHKFNLDSSDPARNPLILLPNYEIKNTYIRCLENFTCIFHRFIVNNTKII
jgi:hypothetical protein